MSTSVASTRAPARIALRVSLVFALAYTCANQLTALRDDVGHGVFEWERAVPFVPWTVVPYLSIFPLFLLSFFVTPDRCALERHVRRLWLLLGLSLACYAAFPLQYVFARPAATGPIGWLFELLAVLDRPYNRAPSLHIGVLVLLWVHWRHQLRGWLRHAAVVWFALIALSVLTTYQHHLLDVPAGAAVALLAAALTRSPAKRAAAALVRASPWLEGRRAGLSLQRHSKSAQTRR